MWKIAKQFDFCYGHRVWNQSLNKEYSLDDRCVCRHLHGHQGKILVYLESSVIKDGMITDFKHLNWFKKFIDDVLDHKFIIDKNDPMFDLIVPSPGRCGVESVNSDVWLLLEFPEGYSKLSLETLKSLQPMYRDIMEGFVFVDFVPTSENLSYWLWKIVQERMKKIDVDCTSVQFFETPKSQANYTNPIWD